jgi:DNA polymerase III delta prime subunit
MNGRFAAHAIPDLLKKALSRLAHSENLAHLFVFASPSIEAATGVAKDFILEWLGSSSPRHPDLLQIKTTGKIGLHTIAGIRSVLDQLSLSPHGAKGRAILIEAADRMLPPTANALLKALEEPPPRTLIVLTSSSPHRLLPTILSRSQVVRIPSSPESPPQLLAPLIDYISSPNRAYTTLQEICEEIQTKLQHDLSAFAKNSLEAISKDYADLPSSAKQEFQQEIEASSSLAMQLRSKQILEAVYLSIRNSSGDVSSVNDLLEAMRGIEAGAGLAEMLSWFVLGGAAP